MELQPGVRGEDAGGGGSGRCARATRPRASATFDRARRRRAEREREPRANERTLALDRPPRPVDPSVPTARPPSVHRSSPSARLTSSPHPGGPRSSSSLNTHTADVISAVEFDRTGEHLATGDRGGRVVLFERIHPSKAAVRSRWFGFGLVFTRGSVWFSPERVDRLHRRNRDRIDSRRSE